MAMAPGWFLAHASYGDPLASKAAFKSFFDE
jgi:hypothetical protein